MSEYKSLSEVLSSFTEIDIENYTYFLDKYLDEMPRNRASAEEILEEITLYDEQNLYITLLQDFRDFMTDEEISFVIENYKKNFESNFLFDL